MQQAENLKKIVDNMEKAIVGKREVIELALITFLSDGHLLLEDVPGVGKTTLGKALAQSVQCSFSRIQFTPDTLPEDVAALAEPVLLHRLILSPEARLEGKNAKEILKEAMHAVKVPVL